jgi:hypothetical protein
MNLSIRTLAIATLIVLSSSAAAAELNLPRDGWASWEVPAVDDAPAMCCFGWKDAPGAAPTCKLDERQNGYSSRDEQTTDAVRVYARMRDGKPERVRALAANCPVQTATAIQDLGKADENASVQWLAGLMKSAADDADAGRKSRSDLLAALAVHRAASALDALSALARSDARLDARKDAVFWLAHVRGAAGARVATELMFDDPNPKLREHAAFAVTQSKSTQIATDLIRLATTDRDPQVRGQAWFWLAHTGAAQTETAIDAALGKESERRVRDQAIFALSRLPEERATSALIKVAENQSLSRADRKKAIFWLAQADSDRATAYLDRVVTTR